MVPDASLSLKKGAIAPWSKSSSPYYLQTMEALARHYKFSMNDPFEDLPRKVRQVILHGSGEEEIKFIYDDGMRRYETRKPFEGVITNMDRRYHETDSDWARATAATLRKRSPLMLHVVLEQIRRARGMGLADDLRMERDMVRHCFYLRPGQSETVEGIRALAVDKDHAPKWNPARIEDVTPEMVAPFFASPWPAHSHPLAALA